MSEASKSGVRYKVTCENGAPDHHCGQKRFNFTPVGRREFKGTVIAPPQRTPDGRVQFLGQFDELPPEIDHTVARIEFNGQVVVVSSPE